MTEKIHHPMGHYYLTPTTNLDGVLRSAKLAQRNTNQLVVIHHHEQGEECNDDCAEFAERL